MFALLFVLVASVFRFFSVFILLLSFCPSLVWLPFVVPCLSSCFPCGSLCFLFPLRTIRKKGRKVFLRPLLSCYLCLDSCIVIKEFRCRCFGFFQFVRLVIPTNAGSIGRLARSYFDFLRHYVDITYNRFAFLK